MLTLGIRTEGQAEGNLKTVIVRSLQRLSDGRKRHGHKENGTVEGRGHKNRKGQRIFEDFRRYVKTSTFLFVGGGRRHSIFAAISVVSGFLCFSEALIRGFISVLRCPFFATF